MKKNQKECAEIRGTLSRESAVLMERGELVSNNGLRQANGRPSLHPEQPDFHIYYGPTFMQEIKEGLKADVVGGLRQLEQELIFDVFIPEIKGWFSHSAVPKIKNKYEDYRKKKNDSLHIIAGEKNKEKEPIDLNSERQVIGF